MRTILALAFLVPLLSTGPAHAIVILHTPPRACDQQVTAADGSAICMNYDGRGRVFEAYRKDDPESWMGLVWRDTDGNGCFGVDVSYFDHQPTPYLEQHTTECGWQGFTTKVEIELAAEPGTYTLVADRFNTSAYHRAIVDAAFLPASGAAPQHWTGTYDVDNKSFSLDPFVGVGPLAAELQRSGYFAIVFPAAYALRNLPATGKGLLGVVAAFSCGLGFNVATQAVTWSNVVTAGGAGFLLGVCAVSSYFVTTDGETSDPVQTPASTTGGGPTGTQSAGGTPVRTCDATKDRTCRNP